MSDAGLAHLPGTTNLTQLNLARTQLSNAGLAYFKDCGKLNRLDVWGCPQVRDSGLTHFKDCEGLTSLEARGTRVTRRGHRRAEEGLAEVQDRMGRRRD